MKRYWPLLLLKLPSALVFGLAIHVMPDGPLLRMVGCAALFVVSEILDSFADLVWEELKAQSSAVGESK